jgi:hypothetical protein
LALKVGRESEPAKRREVISRVNRAGFSLVQSTLEADYGRLCCKSQAVVNFV